MNGELNVATNGVTSALKNNNEMTLKRRSPEDDYIIDAANENGGTFFFEKNFRGFGLLKFSIFADNDQLRTPSPPSLANNSMASVSGANVDANDSDNNADDGGEDGFEDEDFVRFDADAQMMQRNKRRKLRLVRKCLQNLIL